jgi:hypothetical protein
MIKQFMSFRYILLALFCWHQAAHAVEDAASKKLGNLEGAPYVFVVDVCPLGTAEVKKTLRAENAGRGDELAKGIEKGKWPGGIRTLLVYRYEGSEEALIKSGTYRIESGKYIRIDFQSYASFEEILAGRKPIRITPFQLREIQQMN